MSEKDDMAGELQTFHDALSDLFDEMAELKQELRQIGETLGRMETSGDNHGTTGSALATAAEGFRGVFDRLSTGSQLSEMIERAANDDAEYAGKDKTGG